MKLWDKNIRTEEDMLRFTTGKDPLFDRQLAPYGPCDHVVGDRNIEEGGSAELDI